MIIGIDGNEANVERRVGISEYCFELLKQFKELRVSGCEFQVYLKSKPLGHMPEEGENWKYRIVGPSKLWTQIGLPLDLFLGKPRPGVFFSPTHYAPRFSIVPTVLSVMDLSYVYYPDMFKKSDLYQLKNWTAYSVKNASRVLTISESSKNDILEEYKIPENKVVVTYPGIKDSSKFKVQSSNMHEIREKYKIKGKYILFVGTLQPRKNLLKLIEAFSSLQGLQLVIVGKKGWMYEEILDAPKKYGVEDKVLFLDFVPGDDLSVLYGNAEFFILPSLYEGFGLPVLEAMQHGCPVITSKISSLPEAGGDAALYINPENVEDIKNKMEQLLTDTQLRKELIEKGHKQVKKFSWEKTARQTIQVLEEVVGER